MKLFNVGLIGMGTVGTGVAKILLEKDSPLLEKLDCVPVLKGIADSNPDVKGKLNLSSEILFTNDAKALLNNPDIQVVVELIGGINPAKEIIMDGLEKGKDVLNANKMVLALHGSELFSKARQHGKRRRCRAPGQTRRSARNPANGEERGRSSESIFGIV